MNHTPGPWTVHHDTMIGHENAGGMWAVADVGRTAHDGQRWRPEFEKHWESDARLIAAAPEMLEFIWSLATDETNPACAERARALLLRIEGGMR